MIRGDPLKSFPNAFHEVTFRFQFTDGDQQKAAVLPHQAITGGGHAIKPPKRNPLAGDWATAGFRGQLVDRERQAGRHGDTLRWVVAHAWALRHPHQIGYRRG